MQVIDPDPTIKQKTVGRLSMTARGVLVAGLARLQDQQVEGFGVPDQRSVTSGAHPPGYFPILALVSAIGVLIVAIAYYMGSYSEVFLDLLFLSGLLVIYIPCLVRLLSAAPSRFERLGLLSVVGICGFIVQLMISPAYISSYDAMLHWINADTMLKTHHLFSINPLLPVSPYYPGLEIITNALSSISGLNTFQAGAALIAVVRVLMVISLYMFYEQVMMSGRMAGIAVMIYMTNPHFLFFDAMFSYETLALPIVTFILYTLTRYDTLHSRNYRWILVTGWLALGALTLTHHMTDYVFDGFLVLWAIVSCFQASGRRMRKILVVFALSGLLFSFAYMFLMVGNPVRGYLSTYFVTAINELKQVVFGAGKARKLFNSQGVAPPSPIWDRLLMFGSVGLITFGIPLGLISLWKQRRQQVLIITMGIVALGYPVTQLFRFSNYGAEITDRSAAFLFISISFILTVLISRCWPIRQLNRRAIAMISCLLGILVLGGALLEIGPAYTSLPGPYTVIADGRSIEPIGIEAARWSLIHLGPDNRIVTDRMNQVLFGTFGKQRIITQQQDNVSSAPIFYDLPLTNGDINSLEDADIAYVVVDQRLSTSLPLLGFYYETDEPNAFHLTQPISRAALTKFNTMGLVNKVFDDGTILIYDVVPLDRSIDNDD